MVLSKVEKKKKRQEEILWSLYLMKFATRSQIQRLHNLGTDRNAIDVLNRMKDYLHKKNYEGKNVYYLNEKGRELVGATTEVKWTLQAEHHLLRNDMYLHYGKPKDWKIEQEIKIKAHGLMNTDKFIRPDAQFTKDGKWYYLEVDRTQSMIDNKKKIELYALLDSAIRKQFNHHPTIVFYTLTPLRRDNLKTLCQKNHLTCEIYAKEDLR